MLMVLKMFQFKSKLPGKPSAQIKSTVGILKAVDIFKVVMGFLLNKYKY